MSALEVTFALMIRADKLPPPVREHKFHPTRRWRFDFAWEAQQIAVEIEGGVYSRGRHTRGAGFEADCEKYNAATMMGWRVFRYGPTHVRSGEALRQIGRMLRGSNEQ